MRYPKLIYNGKIREADKLLLSADNRSFRYGDGCFETMKMLHGRVILENYHQERIFSSLQLLHFDKPNFFLSDEFKKQVLEIARKNKHDRCARIRLTIFRGNGGLYDVENNFPNYFIQTWDLNSANNKLNENGLVMDIFTDARKVCDKYSHLKSNNYLSYAMAALWVKEHKLNDALLLNPYNKIADSTIANVFIVKDGVIKTPALSEGCVGGVMRKYLLKCFREDHIPVEETSLDAEDLLQASEVFLTNAIFGIKWVKQIGKTSYKKKLVPLLHKKFVAPLIIQPEKKKKSGEPFYLLTLKKK